MALILAGDNTANNLVAGSNVDYNIYGFGGDDALRGAGGNDRLDGGSGNDTMAGGQGNDTYIVDSAADVVLEGVDAGIDTVQASVSYTLGANVENLTLTGLSSISATGNALDNTLIGNNGNNSLNGGAGADTMRGGLGNDFYYVDNAGDVVVENAGEGTDWVFASVSHALANNVENLWLSGGASSNGYGNGLANLIQGNAGNNVLDGRLGADTMSGAGGNDTFYVENVGDVVQEAAGGGTDTVVSNLANIVLGDNIENLQLSESRFISTTIGGLPVLANIAAGVDGTGNALNNVIDGNSQDNDLYGLAGNDTLNGGAGNDYLDGGSGFDAMAGGLGNDTYQVDTLFDTVSEGILGGYDTVYSSVNYTLGANVEQLFLESSATNGTGNTQDNRIHGNSLANVINGSTGADLMFGNGGNDTYYVDNVNDVVSDSEFGTDIPQGSGTDLVYSSVSYTLTYADIENLVLTSTAASATGNALNNTLMGNSSDNTILGLAGNDYLAGYAGNDTLQGGTGGDRLLGGAGNDVLRAVDNVSLVDDGAEDRFVFDTALSAATNVDLIDKATFKAGSEGTDDEIWLENSIFAGLMSTTGVTTGTLGAGYYFEGAGLTGSGQFDAVGIYLDTATGQLRYNATFGTAGDSVLFAVANNGIAGGSASLSADEFTLV